jgi:hypothetical protein
MAGPVPAITRDRCPSRKNQDMPTNLEIVSPEKLLLARPVDMVVIPASEGDMGVLAAWPKRKRRTRRPTKTTPS